MRQFLIISLLLLCSCKVVTHTTDKSTEDVLKQSSSVSTRDIVSMLKDSSNLNIEIDSIRVSVIKDSVQPDNTTQVVIFGVNVKGNNVKEVTVIDSTCKTDSLSAVFHRDNDIVTDEEKTVIAEPPNLTIVLIVVAVILGLLLFIWAKFR